MFQIILCFNEILHVSDGLSVHNQEFQTAHKASGICLTYVCCCMYSFELLMMDGKTVRNMYSVVTNKIN